MIFLLNGDERAARKRFSDNALHSPPPLPFPLSLFPLFLLSSLHSFPPLEPLGCCAASFNFHKLSALSVRLCSAWASDCCCCCCCTAIVAGALSGRRAVVATVAIELTRATYSIASPRSDDVWQLQLSGHVVCLCPCWATIHWCGISFYGRCKGYKTET